MGTFRVNIAIGDPRGQEYEPVEALVDTGATYTTLPGSLLRRLGVDPRDRAEFELADGTVVERGVGQTWLRIDGRSAIVPVVFAEEGSEPLLGAVALEIFLLAVDPVRQRLVPVRGLLMAVKRVASHKLRPALLRGGDGAAGGRRIKIVVNSSIQPPALCEKQQNKPQH